MRNTRIKSHNVRCEKVTRVFDVGPAILNDEFKDVVKYSETFSVGVPQFDITGLPGTALRRLCILGRKYNFQRLVAFLKL